MAYGRLIASVVLFFFACAASAQEHEGRDAASWATDLTSDDLGTRRKSAYALWQLRGDARPHVRALATALRDKDEYVRTTTGRVLLGFDWQRSPNTLTNALPELIVALADERASVRLAAANLIWSAGPVPNMVGGDPPPDTLAPALVIALRDDDARVRANAAASLANLKKHASDALPALRKALQDKDAKVRMWSARALSWIDPGQSMAWILKLAVDPDPGVRAAVYEATSLASGDAADVAFKLLLVGAHDEAPAVRKAAINSIWAFRRAEVLPTLVGILKDDADPLVRNLAARALGSLGDPAAADALLAALSRSDDVTLVGAAAGLASLGPEGTVAFQRVIELLRSGSDMVRSSISMSVGSFGPLADPLLPALVANLEHGSPGVRSMAASALSGAAMNGIRSASMTAVVIAALNDEVLEVRQYAVGTIATIGEDARAAVPGLLALYQRIDPDLSGEVSANAIFWALQQIGPAANDALPLLRKVAAAKGIDQHAAAAALACVATEKKDIDAAVQTLVAGLADESQCGMVLYRLRTVGVRARDAATRVRAWMKPNSKWQLAAAGALVRIEDGEAKDAVEVLTAALDGKNAGRAMSQIRGLGLEGRDLIPALLKQASDPAVSWRSGALVALTQMYANGAEVLAVYKKARKDKDGWIRVLGAHGLREWVKLQALR